jgi:1-deoxy-D-xylulose-5-phosphate synthase
MAILDRIDDPADLKRVPVSDLPVVAAEIRSLITSVLEKNGGHLASGLGVVDLTIALHYVYDFLKDVLIWDVSHQAYPHKILTGRRDRFHTIRQRHGLAGYTSPDESPYDHYLFAHAGTSISTALGYAVARADQDDRRTVAVIGDASIATGVAFEALNHAGSMARRNLLVILNDNEMSISKSVGALSEYLSRVRAGTFYNEAKEGFHQLLKAIPLVGARLDRAVEQAKEMLLKTVAPGGSLFEALGPRYFGPVNGHDVAHLISILSDLKRHPGFMVLHVITNKGHGHGRAASDPIGFHGVSPKIEPFAPPDLEFAAQGEKTWSNVFAECAIERGRRDPDLHVITAAMPDNTGVTKFQKSFPERAHDVGICEQHGVAFASGLRKAGKRPVCAIFSTFLQRAFDQIFQEVALNRVPVVFCLDRAGIVGPDGATHNGCFDIAYLRAFPGIDLMSPRDESEFHAMFDLALDGDHPAAIRYPRTFAPHRDKELPVRRELVRGRSETLRTGGDLALVALGHMVYPALEAADALAASGLSATVVNARFVRPLDLETVRDLTERFAHVFTIEEHSIRGGFAAHVLEELALHRGRADRIRPISVPDAFVPHGTRSEMLRELRLDPAGLAAQIREVVGAAGSRRPSERRGDSARVP